MLRTIICARRSARIVLVTLAALGAACTRDPAFATCTGAFEIELVQDEILVGDNFTAEATHRDSECLNNLNWTVAGPIQLVAAEGFSATFRANAAGNATISVRNNLGTLGVAEIEVEAH
jgi:hypothetical protein